MTGSAVLSPDEAYRYTLERHLEPNLFSSPRDVLRCLFVMLNPSTADAHEDDPTIRRCVAFARSWGYSTLSVVNLFAFRATDPEKLLNAGEPVGPDNDAWIRSEARRSELIVAAWGTHGYHQGRDEAVLALLREAGKPVYCLGTTRSGQPRHPLYLPGVALPELLENVRPTR